MAGQDESFDFIIVGSGGGSVPAALAMKSQGKRPLIIEKQSLIGGSSAFSGGVIWIPDNDFVEGPDQDSPARARTYLDAVVGEAGPSTSPARKDAYIRNGTRMLRFLQTFGMKFQQTGWPDYYPDKPGGMDAGRSICAPMFDVNRLGAWKDKLAKHPMTTAYPLTGPEGVKIATIKTTWAGKWVALKVAIRILRKKLFGTDLRGAGNSMQGRLYEIALREGIDIWTDSPVKDFIEDKGRIVGVVIERDGKTIEVRSKLGVLINAGGFSHNLEMREKYQPKPTSVKWTASNPGDTGEMILAAQAHGSAIDHMDQAWWLGMSYLADGTCQGFHVPNDIVKPHAIVVGKDGRRFANEGKSYMEFGQDMYATGNTPALIVFDAQHRSKYNIGMTPPGITPKELIDSGYLRRYDSLDDLARGEALDAGNLRDTVDRYNRFSKTGVDEDFGRGSTSFSRFFGDPAVKPNPNLAPIDKAPFYAITMQPGDVGTSGGIMTDEHARVLREDGSVVDGLYATGNSTASVMGRRYPGAGTSVGPSMTFGYIAARHAAGVND